MFFLYLSNLKEIWFLNKSYYFYGIRYFSIKEH